MKKVYQETLQSFIDLILPRLCFSCRNYLSQHEKGICIECIVSLPFTDHFNYSNNALHQQLSLQLSLEHAVALCYFNKEGLVANLIHQLKYKKQKHIGTLFGQWLGEAILKSSNFSTLRGIIPVPLHSKRKRERGYNQSEIIASAVSEIIQKPVYTNYLKRIIDTPPLALADQSNRWKIIKNAFETQASLKKTAGHFLLIDDVVTSGATLTACAKTLLEHSQIKLSIAVVGYRF